MAVCWCRRRGGALWSSIRRGMAYAELLKTAGHPSQSKLVWALLEDHYRKLTALLEQVRQQAPDVALETPRWKM